MENYRPWFMVFWASMTMHALLWHTARSQVEGFLSVECGSSATSDYVDSDGIVWVSDTQLMKEGKPLPVTGGSDYVLSTLRLFDGNQSKYCYVLSNSAVTKGACFLVRASIWAGITPPYTPRAPDGIFRFNLIVDGDLWKTVAITYGNTTWYAYEIYIRAQRSTIDVCVARSTPNGDAPFISGLELRPLPSTFVTSILMNMTNFIFSPVLRSNFGVLPSAGPTFIRYPNDQFDRLWLNVAAEARNVRVTESSINVDDFYTNENPPVQVMQSALIGDPDIVLPYHGLDPNAKYFVEFYFAEIDPAVNASRQRSFNIYANGDLQNSNGAIDVFGTTGAYAAFTQYFVVGPTAKGDISFNFTVTNTSLYPAYLAGAELFKTQPSNPITKSDLRNVIEEIKLSLGLSSYTGDPCLPLGFEYNWLNCSDSSISAISLSNYHTSGMIPSAISALTSITKMNLQNNNLSGAIPADLLKRKQASLLDFQFSGNQLCESSTVTCEASPSPGNASQKKNHLGIIIGAVVAGILLMGLAIAIAIYFLCRGRPSFITEQPVSKQQDLQANERDRVIKKVISKTLQEFSFEEIMSATDNLRTLIGEGGYGSVYKGRLNDDRIVAIKVASDMARQGSKEFLNEVNLLSRIHHKNLVGFLGYCDEERLVLVYEFMAKGSLFDCLHGQNARISPLPWTARLRIMIDAAQGLHYLHHGCNPRIIHRDIKSSNILLNDCFEAKISDFGISRNYLVTETGAPPTALMGSMGYIDPEYLQTMKLTDKVDVYSFGVLMFEVVCGRPVILNSSQQQIHIVQWASSSLKRGVIDDIMDPILNRQYDTSSVWKVLETALACVEFQSSKRPSMSDVFLGLKEAERLEIESINKQLFDPPSAEFMNQDDDGYSGYFDGR
ncbi:hypothetical protein KP509_10G070600 [Ceratopteris richardii]|uniref:Protein kinase domain-containing protein n=2 Tax=Ceratopteris richardii TaxID=49495 RepID=A0A8T2U2I7_CERRI|nr:hypothetical protein KP509_10G070600 [Ceratopteris richardii]